MIFFLLLFRRARAHISTAAVFRSPRRPTIRECCVAELLLHRVLYTLTVVLYICAHHKRIRCCVKWITALPDGAPSRPREFSRGLYSHGIYTHYEKQTRALSALINTEKFELRISLKKEETIYKFPVLNEWQRLDQEQQQRDERNAFRSADITALLMVSTVFINP